MIELKPCPVCGLKAVLVESVNTQRFHVECTNATCSRYMTPWFPTKREAVEAWNRRVNND